MEINTFNFGSICEFGTSSRKRTMIIPGSRPTSSGADKLWVLSLEDIPGHSASQQNFQSQKPTRKQCRENEWYSNAGDATIINCIGETALALSNISVLPLLIYGFSMRAIRCFWWLTGMEKSISMVSLVTTLGDSDPTSQCPMNQPNTHL